MAIYYIDPDDGNDSADGLTLNTSGLPTVGPWKTWTSGPTAARITDGDTIRFKETPQTSLGSCTWTNNSQTVTAGSSFGFYITESSSTSGWTAGANCSITTSSLGKSATNATTVVIAAAFTTGQACYFDYGSQVDLSSYNTLSFIMHTSSAITTASSMTINLCSDSAGTTVVDSLVYPFATTSSQFIAVSLSNGSNFGNNIRSISFNFSSDPGTTNITFSNFIATTGISHRSLICKGDNLYYPIKCITSSTSITLGPLIDSFGSTSNPTYHGTTESVTSYYITPHYFINGSAQMTNPPERPAFTTINTIEGGYVWNGSSNVKSSTGITALTGTSGSTGAASSGSASHGWMYKDMVYSNGTTGISGGSKGNIYDNVSFVGFSTPYTQTTGAYISFRNCNFICNRNTVSVNGSSNFYNCKFLSCAANTRLLTAGTGGNQIICENCVFQGSCSSATLVGPGVNAFYSNPNIVLKNCLVSPSSEFSFTGDGGIMYSLNHDQTQGNNRIFSHGGNAYWQTTTYYGANPGSWRVDISSDTVTTGPFFPFYLELAEVAVESGSQVTVTCWCKKDNASETAAKLCIIEDNGILGATAVEDLKANDTNWEQLSIQFTPTVNGVIKIYGAVWRSVGVSAVYFGPITVTQA